MKIDQVCQYFWHLLVLLYGDSWTSQKMKTTCFFPFYPTDVFFLLPYFPSFSHHTVAANKQISALLD